MDSARMDDNDRISWLPEAIAHNILSFLTDSPKQLVRMSVLSKNWFSVTASFPILDFNLFNFDRDINGLIRNDFSPLEDLFFKYVEYTTSRFCNRQNNVTCVHTFNLIGSLVLDNPSQLSIVDTCIGLVLKNGLEVFHVDIYTTNSLPRYRLPNVLLSVSSLSSLIIHHCELPSSLMVDDAIKFKSLKLLNLDQVDINEQVIERLTTCCPLLVMFVLMNCRGFKRFCINGLQNLEHVVLYFYGSIVETIDIDAPKVWRLLFEDQGRRGAPRLNISSCKKLESLSYNGRFEASTDFLSNFPCLQYLALSTIHPNLKLSSHSLKILALNPCCDLDVTDIHAPNLVFLKFSLYKSSKPLVRNPAKSEPQMEWFPVQDVNALLFKKLRRFLNKTTGFFKVLKLIICSGFIDVEELKVIDSPPIELKHVEVELRVREEPGTIDKLSAYVSAVDAVFWCLRPQSLTLISDFESLDFDQRSHIVKFTYEKLLQQNDEDQTDIEIELSTSSSKDKKHFNDLKSLLAALPCEPLSHIITLIKVEDSNAVKEA